MDLPIGGDASGRVCAKPAKQASFNQLNKTNNPYKLLNNYETKTMYQHFKYQRRYLRMTICTNIALVNVARP